MTRSDPNPAGSSISQASHFIFLLEMHLAAYTVTMDYTPWTGAVGFGVITGDVMRQGQAFAEGGYGSAHLALLGGFPLLAGSRVVTMVCGRDNKLSCL